MPAYGTVMLPSESYYLVRHRNEVTRPRAGLAWEEEPTRLSLKDRDAHHIPDAKRDPSRWRSTGKHIRCVGSALSSCSSFCRSVIPRAAFLHRTCARRWRKGKYPDPRPVHYPIKPALPVHHRMRARDQCCIHDDGVAEFPNHGCHLGAWTGPAQSRSRALLAPPLDHRLLSL